MKRATILNVDDNEAGRFAVTQVLRHAGFEVSEARTGNEALQMAEQLPDIMLLDIRLPDLSGLEVCRQLKGNPKTAGITIVHLSASLVAPTDRAIGLEGGADGYLTEPINHHELIATLRAFLRLRQVEASQRFLAHVSTVLSTVLAADDTLRKIAHLAVPFLGDVCLVDKITEQGNVVPIMLAMQRSEQGSAEPQFEQLASLADSGEPRQGVSRVVASGSGELHAQVSEDAWLSATLGIERHKLLGDMPVTSYMCVPLIARQRTLGAVTFLSCSKEREFSPVDLALAQDFASRSALLVDNARLYEEARKAVRLRENLLAVVSHDLKNPLTNISMNAIVMLKQWPTDEKVWRLRGYVESIQRAAGRMNHLIHDLLDLASLDAGALSLEPRSCSAEELTAEIVEMLEPLALEKSIRIAASARAGLPHFSCDKERILQVLSNLIGNALKFTPVGGSVVIGADAIANEPNVVRFTVEDTGSGIAEKQLPYIFDRFWQASETARFGTGLGLSIAKGIVEAHGGRIWVEKTSAQGSVFAFTLPTTQARSTPV